MEKSRELARDIGRAENPFARKKGQEPLIPDDAALTNDEFSSRKSPSTSPPLGRNARGSIRVKSQRKNSHCSVLSNVVSGASCRAREQADRRQNQPNQAPPKCVSVA